MSVKRYVVIDENGFAVNTVLWDGQADWSPPEGRTVALENSRAGKAALKKAETQNSTEVTSEH